MSDKKKESERDTSEDRPFVARFLEDLAVPEDAEIRGGVDLKDPQIKKFMADSPTTE